jgi:hypothetical protein
MDLSDASMSSNPSFFHNELIVSTEIEYCIGVMPGGEVGSACHVGGDTAEKEERVSAGKIVEDGEEVQTGADALISTV